MQDLRKIVGKSSLMGKIELMGFFWQNRVSPRNAQKTCSTSVKYVGARRQRHLPKFEVKPGWIKNCQLWKRHWKTTVDNLATDLWFLRPVDGSTPSWCSQPHCLTNPLSRTWLSTVWCWPQMVRRCLRRRRTTPTPWSSSTSTGRTPFVSTSSIARLSKQNLSGGVLLKHFSDQSQQGEVQTSLDQTVVC